MSVVVVVVVKMSVVVVVVFNGSVRARVSNYLPWTQAGLHAGTMVVVRVHRRVGTPEVTPHGLNSHRTR